MVNTKYCLVCRNDKENLGKDTNANPSLFQFPNSPRRRKKWIKNLQIDEGSIKTGSRVCEIHFNRSQFVRTKLKPTAVPLVPFQQNVTYMRPVLTIIPQISCAPLLCINPNAPNPVEHNPIQVKNLPKHSEPIERKENKNRKRLITERLEDKRRIRRLQARITTLKSKLKQRIDLKAAFCHDPIFCQLIESQVGRHKKRKKKYTEFEKTAALSLYYACGPNGYKTLKKLGFCMPVRSTLQQWTREFKMFTGINKHLFDCVQEVTKGFSETEKDCLLTWDEMGIKEYIEYNKFYDMFEGVEDYANHGRTLETANEVLVFMIRGINSSWKFPLAYYFSKGATTSELLEVIVEDIISAVQSIGLKVRIAVCDMSFTNQGLYRTWSLTESEPYKVFNNQRIYFIHDTPHLIKLVRNNLMRHTFILNQGTKQQKVKWSHISTFYTKDRRVGSRMAPKLTNSHIYLKDFSKMRVKLATQVFSRSVYAGIMTMCRLKILKNDFMVTGMFVKTIDEIFDFLNMSSLHNDKFGRCAAHFYPNISKLDKFLDFFDSISIPTMSKKLPDFLKGLKMTVTGIKLVALDLFQEGYRHLYTRNLQQDCLENYFALIRSKGGYCKNPTARCFRTNFRFLFFATLIHTPLSGNTESNDDAFGKYVNNIRSVMAIEGDQHKLNESCISHVSSNDEQINSEAAAQFYSVKLTRKLKYGKEQEAEVASYVGAACVKASLKLTNCSSCQHILVNKKDISRYSSDKYLLIDFKQFDNLCNHLSYLRSKECQLFQLLNSIFLKYTCDSLKVNGTNVLSVITQLYVGNEKVHEWLTEECAEHRMSILKYFIRAKLYRLIKDKNDSIRQVRSWSQTRRDLRNQ